MMEPSRERNPEFGLFALAFGLALVIRLLRLGEMPLTDGEARWAMQAFDLTKGLRPEIGAQPAYVLLTALSFFVMQASNFAARFVPALFGAALTCAPFYFRDRLGSKPAIVLAFFPGV
jgi:predicted membrane-bound mannosyltransferase